MTTLRSSLQSLAASFASSVLDAIRGASLDELLGEGGARGARRGRGRPPKSPPATGPSRKTRKSGRLARRSAADIAKALDRVVALVKVAKNTGLRAEQIRVALGMQAKEMPRVLGEGLAKKKLRAKGKKRATTYFAA